LSAKSGVKWALYLSPILLIVATILWISYWSSLPDGDGKKTFAIIMAGVSAVLALVRLLGISRKSKEGIE
jgi:hypothetical protein